ncbi:MAG: autotransporter-associated beta strand repeat-containing protein [Bacteroidetes bacterium]|nr:autotransporter-associated beta strand repeat-containing protein [Bacteroidota bacterium]
MSHILSIPNVLFFFRSRSVWAVLFLLFFGLNKGWGQTTTETFTTTGTNTWVCPPGVTSIDIECWGAGGGGGGAKLASSASASGGGGAGGGYVKRTSYAVTPGISYTIYVGAGGTAGTNTGTDGGDGEASYFIDATTIMAVGGNGGKKSTTASGNGAGGAAKSTGNIGFSSTFSYYGGSGGTGSSGCTGGYYAGGGGASAGTIASTSSQNGACRFGGTGPTGGIGGADAGWSSSGNGSAGSTKGSGGSGAKVNSTTGYAGGDGGDGQLNITYTTPSYTTVTLSTAGASSWTVPCGVTSIQVEAWGGGGGGGSTNTTNWGGSGGGGGAYAKSIFLVTGTPTYFYSVGNKGSGASANAGTAGAGGDSWFNTSNAPPSSNTTGVLAKGGGAGFNSVSTTPTNGGTSSSSLSNVVKYSGGNGGAAGGSGGGGGGSSAGTGTGGNNGNAGSVTGDGAGGAAPTGGFAGGAGVSSGNGSPGSSPGGGGGGSDDVTTASGGDGGVGRIVIKYVATATTPTAAVISSPANESINIAASGTTLNWINGGGASTYKVYFGTDNPPSNIVNGTNQSGTSYDPGTLTNNQTYYWRIDAVDASGCNTTTGPVWSFKTEAVPTTFYSKSGQTDANNLANWSSNTAGTGVAPTSFATAGQTFIIQSGHQYQATATWTGSATSIIRVQSGGALDINGQTLSTWQRMDISGTGVSGSGVFFNSSTSAANLSIPVTLTGVSTIVSSGSGGLTLSGNIDNGGNLLTIGGSNATTISTGVISGTGGLTKVGTGTLTLSGANTFTGAVSVDAGVLNIQNATGTGTTAGGVVVASGAALELQGGITVGAETLTINNTGVSNGGSLRNISGNNTWGGTVTLSTNAVRINSDAGTLTLNASNSITATNIGLTVGGAGNITISGTITTGNGTLTKDGSGTATLSGANTFTGGATLSAGTLNINNASALGTTAGAFTINGGTIDNTTGASITTSNYSMNWGADVNFTGTQSLNLGTGAVNMSASRQVTVNGNTLTVGGGISGASSNLTKAGAGNLVLSGANTYGGTTTISGGTLTLGAANALPNTALTISSGATFAMEGFSETVASISGAGTISSSSGTPTLTCGDANSTTFSGTIGGGAIALTKTGTGALTLSGANTYTGLTTISAGTLILGNPSALGGTTNGTSITSGAVLDLNGTNYSNAEALTVNGTGISNGGAIINSSSTGATYAGLLTLGSTSSIIGGTGTISISNTGTITGATFGLTLGGAQGGSIASIIGTTTGTLTKQGAGTWTLSGANTYTGGTTINDGTITLGGLNALPISSSAGTIRFAVGTPTLNLGLFNLGSSTLTTNSAGALDFDVNTTINLGAGGTNSYFFKASGSQTWDATTITINNWTGTAGESGTGPKIFIGSSASLSTAQLAKIIITGYGQVTQLSTGEVVPIGVYYSLSGQSNPNLLTNWTSNADGSGSNPGSFTGDGMTFIVQSGHSYTTTAPWNLTGTATLQVDGNLILSHVLTLGTASTKAANLIVNGTVRADAQHNMANTSGVFTISNGGRYVLNHNSTNNGSTIFGGVESFNNGSTFEYANLGSGGFISSITYHHLTISGNFTHTFPATITINGDLNVSAGTISMNKDQMVSGAVNVSGGTLQITNNSSNCTLTATGGVNVTGGTFNMSVSTGTAAISGNVSVSGTGTFNMAAGTGAPTITGNVAVSGGSFYAAAAGAGAVTSTIAGNLSVTGGTFYVTGNTPNTTHILDLNGTLDLSNTGVIEFNPIAAATGAGRLYVSANVTVSGGTMQRTQTRTDGSTGIYFDGTTQTFTWSGGAITNAMPNRFYVNGVTTLDEVYSHLSSAQTTVNGLEGTPAVGSAWPTSIRNLTIGNTHTSGVTLSTPKTLIGSLTFNDGFLVTDATNILTIANANTNAIVGAGTGKYVSGPLRWNLSNSPTTYVFPVGKSSGTNPGYYPFTLASSSVSSPIVTVEVFNTNAGGGICAGGGVTDGSLSTTEYWSATLNSGSLIGSVSLTRPLTSLGSLDVIAQSATANGNYFGIGGTVSGSNSIINSTNINTFGFFRIGVKSTNCINPDPGNIIAPSNFPASGLFCGSSFTPTQITNDVSNNPSGACSMEFKWQFSTDDGANWTDISSSNATSYTPSTITLTTWYKRVVRALCKTNWSDATETAPVILAIGCENPSNGGVINAPTGYPASGVCGSSYTFTSAITNSIEASGACSIEYKWQSSTNNGVSWTDISSSNATSYTPTAINQTTWYKRLARATCKADWNGAVETEPVKIILGNLLTTGGLISRNQGACGGFNPLQINSASAAGPCTPKYQWQFRTALTDWADVSGATSVSYDPPAITETTRYRRAAIVSTSNDWSTAVFSNTVVMTVATAVGISLNPLNDTVYQEKGVATFVAKSNFTAAGAATFQWQVSTDGGNIFSNLTNGGYYSGVLDTILNVNNPIYAMNGYRYRCVITSVNTSCGTVTTNAATLSVLPIIVATNINSLACNSWTSSSVEVTIPVSNVGVLNTSTSVLRQINLSIGNNGACAKALNTYSFSLRAPNGTVYKFVKGLTTTGTSVWANIQFRDHPALERINQYPTTVQQEYFPYSIGYYGVEGSRASARYAANNRYSSASQSIFISTFNGINANGDWKLIIEKNNGTAGGISLEKAELFFGPKIATKDVTGNTINNSCEFATCFGSDASVIIGTNNGYLQDDPNYPGESVNGCSWNGANNNSAWYYFFASSSTANVTVSGLKSITNTTSADMQLIVLDGGSNGCGTNWAVPAGGCPKSTNNNASYVNSSNPYSNGITANVEFKLTGLTAGKQYYLMVDGNGGVSSSFYIEAPSGGQRCVLENILPVRYISFDAFFKNGQTELIWKTAQEINNRHFLIERSGDGKNWEIIKVVPGASDRTESIRKYQTTDRNPLKGVNYYRLKQVDLDGRFSYSDIRTVHNNTLNGLSLFPNPGNGWFTVSGLSKGTPHQIRVVDMAGKLMHSGITNAAAESYRFNMDHAAPGVYFLQVDGKEYLRMVVTK